MNRARWSALVLIAVTMVFSSACGRAPQLREANVGPVRSDELSEGDIAAIRRTLEAYRRAWLAGDAEGVLETFTEDAVLLPHHGNPPVTGLSAIRAYWFGPGPATTITELTMTVDRTAGNHSLAFVHGKDTVAWTTVKDGSATRFFNSGTYLNVMKKMPDAEWRILAHMWDDPANQRRD